MKLVLLFLIFMVDVNADAGKIAEGTLYVVSYLLKDKNPSAVDAPPTPSDMIVGQCEYKGNSCNGAKVILLSNEGKKINESILVSQSFFKFPKLHETESYTLELSWRGQVLEKRLVKTGKFILIKISKN